jgi:hypothetical protein
LRFGGKGFPKTITAGTAQGNSKETATAGGSRRGSIVDLAAVRNPSYADVFRRIIDYVHHTPIANSDAATDLCGL